MNLNDQIKLLANLSENEIPQRTRKQEVGLYSEGLKAKVCQVHFALENLNIYSEQTDETVSTTVHENFEISEKVGFYYDSFWTFLYLSLDVLGQIINQALKLCLDEKDVSFKSVANHLSQTQPNSPLQKKIIACKNSQAFKNLDSYRNCSTHRRQIYIKEEIKLVRHTAGYQTNSTGSLESVERILCDNPLNISPRITQGRKIPTYMEETKNKIIKHIITILKNTNPVR